MKATEGTENVTDSGNLPTYGGAQELVPPGCIMFLASLTGGGYKVQVQISASLTLVKKSRGYNYFS